MENGGLNQKVNQRYNYIQFPDFKLNSKTDKNHKINNINSNNNSNYLCQSQNISNKNKDKENPLTLSIADKIKEMKEELSKENYISHQKNNNDFKMRLERLAKGKTGLKNENNSLRNSKEIDLNSMKNKIKSFEDQREKEKTQKKNALDELDDMFNNFRNNRYGN